MALQKLTASSRLKPILLEAPIDRWDEAVPLGNGLLGGLLWGSGNTLKLSLDRGDLWDERISNVVNHPDWNWATMKKLVRQKNAKRFGELFEALYWDPYPTKIPAGRLEFDLGRTAKLESFSLDLKTALGTARWAGGEVEAFCSAVAPVIMMRFKDKMPKVIRKPAEFWKLGDDAGGASVSKASLGRLGYGRPRLGQQNGTQYVRQVCAQGFEYAVVFASRNNQLAIAICTNHEAADPVSLGQQRVQEALDAGFDRSYEAHRRWWSGFWSRSAVQVPDPAIEDHYYFVQYLYGSASRRGAPPMPLQGVWTADEGKLPPWKGDYHHDLNTQLCYGAYHAADHLDEGACFLDLMWNLLAKHRQFARDFYATAGAVIPSVMSLAGQAIGGWGQYSYSPTNGAWVAHHFYLHWRYSMDRVFLEQRAFPYCLAIAEGLAGILTPGKDGKLKLPLSCSPEIHDNRLEAFLTPNSNYDLALLRWLFGAVAEMAGELGRHTDARFWKKKLGCLEELAVDKKGFMISPDERLQFSHRHLSHLIALHPLGIVPAEQSQTIAQSFRHLDYLGAGQWCGYTYSWIACMAARTGHPERALSMLKRFVEGFISRNGFHLNGDFKNLGLSGLKYRPFTLEGNFYAAQAVHEMLLQSYSGVIRVFPAMPATWQDAAFSRLRTEGAFRVSARRVYGKTTWVHILAEKDSVLRLRDPFDGQPARWSRKLTCAKGEFKVRLKAGEELSGCVSQH